MMALEHAIDAIYKGTIMKPARDAQLLARFAEVYADQTDRDFGAHVKAAEEQLIPAAKTA
jgi:hypothetical protein